MSSGEIPRVRGMPRPLSGGPIKFGPYWLDARLAVGGTAEVYVGRPIDANATPRRLVIKRLLPQFAADPEGRTMFEREAALHAAVHHENVVQVYAYGLEGDEPWLAMELVDGCDLFRLLRRLSGERRTLGAGVSSYLARELLRGLESAHGALDPSGQPMGIIHRDVTPSNVYLSGDGRVKLGDFGIARSSSRATIRTTGSAALKGKFAYLSPEQVAGETFDQRADLFSTAVVLSEMLLGHPLFAGSGQLAVLLAIRDCRIDSLREASASLPKGLFPVLERALARDPSKRFQTAAALSEALAPFAADAGTARGELGALVRWVQTAPSVEQINAVREGAAQLRSSLASRPETESTSERTTGEYTSIPSFVVTARGERVGPWAFARLVEAIATGQVGRGDMVDYMGRGLAMLESIESLARFLPALTAATTNRLGGVTSPEFVDAVSVPSLVAVLLRAVESEATGVLFAEGPTESRALPKMSAGGQSERGRKELYIVNGKLHHVASNNASELLGEYLVRRSVISREELDFALAVLPRYGGRMGDTLISLGLVSSLDIFRAIRDQGKDRLVDLFRWQSGELSFYAGQTAKHVEFPLDLEIPPLILAGLEAAKGEVQLEAWRPRLDHLIGPPDGAPPKLHAAAWPPLVRRLLVLVDHPKPLREVLAAMAQGGAVTASEALRAVDVLLIAKLLVWR
jgi:serine/threonine-protein kinase